MTVSVTNPRRPLTAVPWQPARPLGTRWTRTRDSVRFLASVAGLATGSRTVKR